MRASSRVFAAAFLSLGGLFGAASVGQAAVITNTWDPADVLISSVNQPYSFTHNFGQTFAPGSITGVTLEVFFTDQGGSELFTISYIDPVSVSSFPVKNVPTSASYVDGWVNSEFTALYDGIVGISINLDSTNASNPGATFTKSVLTITYDPPRQETQDPPAGIPEPGTLGLLGAGLAAIALAGRKRRKA